jgi:hypothetical protein
VLAFLLFLIPIVRSVEKGHEHVMRNADQLDVANAAMLMVERALEADDASGACAVAIPIWKASASAVGGRSPSAPAEDIPLRKHNPGWSASFLLEKSLEFNKKCKSMEQLLAYQQWDLCMGFIDAAAAEKLAQHLLGMYKDEGVTVQVQDAYDLGTTPLRPSEAPIPKVTPAGILEKCKWRTTIERQMGPRRRRANTIMGRRTTLPHRRTRSDCGLPRRPTSPSTSDVVRLMYHRRTTSPEKGTTRMGIRPRSSCARPAGTMQSR